MWKKVRKSPKKKVIDASDRFPLKKEDNPYLKQFKYEEECKPDYGDMVGRAEVERRLLSISYKHVHGLSDNERLEWENLHLSANEKVELQEKITNAFFSGKITSPQQVRLFRSQKALEMIKTRHESNRR